MRVVVLGATGNVGTSIVPALVRESRVTSVLAVARRRPETLPETVEFREADVESTDLRPLLDGADAVVHLAWRIQPSRDLNALWRTNVEGSSRVASAAVEAKVKTLVYASSVGVYSPGPKDERVDESWPAHGVPTSFYARHKAEVERRLDEGERSHSGLRVVRIRSALVFKREAASGVRRLFLGPFLPSPLVRASLLPVVPRSPGLAFQAVHADDLADAYVRSLTRDVRGAFNVAAEPLLTPETLAEAASARVLGVPAAVLRGAAELTWRLRLQPSPPGWIDLALGVPAMDTSRARSELGWEPKVSATDALRDLMRGLRERAGAPTPPLDPRTGGPVRFREIASGLGGREAA
jgi:nucleoside-diphosphate-sugar epimerase